MDGIEKLWLQGQNVEGDYIGRISVCDGVRFAVSELTEHSSKRRNRKASKRSLIM